MTRAFKIVLLLLTLAAPARASDIGIVIMHGLQGSPGSAVTGRFESAMKANGYAIQTPEMCWSEKRLFDTDFLGCLRDIDAAVAKLQGAGARRIVIAGQSLGGNAALSYAALHPGVAGVIALAPAGNAAGLASNPQVQPSIAQARQMVAGGHANDRAHFTTTNNGKPVPVDTTAAIFLSFTDPQGPAAFSRLLFRVSAPVLWVAGNADQTQRNADAQFAVLPPNPLNRMEHVTAAHLETPAAAVPAALEWLKTLPAR
jgi:pimeloyl-ACP methyl ester carboxylesterase